MPPSTHNLSNPPGREPRFNPMWWWVIGAFVLLIGSWTTIYLIARANPVEEIELPAKESSETTPPEASP